MLEVWPSKGEESQPNGLIWLPKMAALFSDTVKRTVGHVYRL